MTNIINRTKVELTKEYFVSVIEFENGGFEVAVFDSEYEFDERFLEDAVKLSSQKEVDEFIENEIKPHYTGFVQTTYRGVNFDLMDADVAKAAKYYIKSGDSVGEAISKAECFVGFYSHTYRIYA